MTGEPILLLTEKQHMACLGEVRGQLDAGRHPRFVTVTVPTPWGWVSGRHIEEKAALAVDQVVVRKPQRTAVESAASGPDRTIWLYGAQPINLRILSHVSGWLFLFGGLMATLGHLVGTGWMLAVAAALVTPVELQLRHVRRSVLRTAPAGSSHARHLALLATSPSMSTARLWEAAEDPDIAARYASELGSGSERQQLQPGQFDTYTPEDPQ